MGRHKVPAVLKKGMMAELRKDRDGAENEFVKLTSLPAPPEFVQQHPQVRSLWYSVCQNLLEVNLLYEIILPQIERYVKLAYAFDSAFEDVLERGASMIIIRHTRDGEPYEDPQINPAWRVMTTANAELMKMEDRIALNISAMARLSGNSTVTPLNTQRNADPFGLDEDD